MLSETIRVLSIEDNAGDTRLIREMLDEATVLGWELPRFELACVGTLAAALARLEEGDIDVVLSDLDLPDSGADETLARLRVHAPLMPVVVLTGREDEVLARHAVRAGAEDYLFKREMSGSLLAHSLLYAMERRRARTALREAHSDLERRVQQRTAELERANAQLRREIAERQRAEQALRESERQQGLILNAMAEMVAYYDTDLRVIWANRASAKSVGKSPEELIGQHCYQIWHQREQPCVECPLLRAQRDKMPRQGEQQTPDGRHWFLRGYPILDEEDQVVALVEFGQDITERKQVEEALRESEARFRDIVENAEVGYFYVDMDGRYRRVNRAWLRMHGYSSPEEVIGQHFSITQVETDLEEATRLGERVLRGEPLGMQEFTRRCKDGTVGYHSFASRPVTRDGRVVGLEGFMTDLTERRRMEEALRESQANLSALIENTEGSIWSVDRDYRLLVGSSVFRQEISTVRGRPFAPGDNVLEDESLSSASEEWREYYDRALRGERFSVETRRRFIDTSRHMEFRFNPIHAADGAVTGVTVFGRDITEHKRAEAQLQHYAAELQRSNQELQQFAHIASHDLQEPLRTIGSFARLLAERYQGRLDDQADEFIDFIVDGVERMQELLRSLLAYSRVGSQGQEPTITDSQIVLQRALAALRTAIAESAAEITYSPLPVVVADAVQMNQLLQNLLSNALKFRGPEPPRVHVSAGREEGWWVFSVRDNGIGIDPRYHEEVFEPLRRLHTRREVPGTGMGLAICARIVARHGGRIWVESMPGEGATFYFTLPDSQMDAA